jgi:hypothetical protein
MAGNRGINSRQSGTRIIVKELAQDLTATKITTGTMSIRCWELQTDGSYKTYDFNDNTFKATTPTTPTASATHQTAQNGAYNTGNWTYVFGTVTGFTVDEIYVVEFSHASMTGVIQRQFQYGGGDGDFVVTSGKVDATMKAVDAAVVTGVKKNVAKTFMVYMVLASDHKTPATGKTLVVTASKDQGAFGSIGTPTEISGGWYKIAFLQAAMNCDELAVDISEATCDKRAFTVETVS